MKHFGILCIALAAALLPLGKSACAQVYSWKDPHSGQSKISNIAPPWYSRGDIVTGPRVIETLGGKVVDDTALPYEDRLLLSGKSKDSIEKLRLQKQQASYPPQAPIKESAENDAEAANRRSAIMTQTRGETGARKRS